ncbi:MAG: threonine aldolase [Glaciecola sp.]|jgi:threonine aldolase
MDNFKDEAARLEASCTRALVLHGQRNTAQLLAELPTDIVSDEYGDGGVVSELEDEVAELLGVEAAIFLPSGTMAQQIALRIHADASARRTVLLHPTSHPVLHEDQAMERLHGLQPRPVGDPTALLSRGHLDEVAEAPAALLLELPQREIGGQLPEWDDLVAQVQWAQDRGAAVHLDGARLWQCGVAYDRSLPEIAALFDTMYVSFYKDLGGLSGSCLTGSLEFAAEVREWRHRHGGTLFAMWPYAASSLAALRMRLPRMASYRTHALALAAGVDDLDGVRVHPGPPQTSMFHLKLRGTATALLEGLRSIAKDDGISTWSDTHPTGHPDWRSVEMTVGDATLDFTPAEFRSIAARIVEG